MASELPKNIIIVHGYFVNYDKYHRAKLMFLDDYDYEDTSYTNNLASNNLKLNTKKFFPDKMSFTKSYLTNKAEKTEGHNPIIDNKYFLVNCAKNTVGYLSLKNDDTRLNLAPIQDLIQHTVECDVSIKHYKFTGADKKIVQGWNIKLLKMKLVKL